jgi:hypothetical protein
MIARLLRRLCSSGLVSRASLPGTRASVAGARAGMTTVEMVVAAGALSVVTTGVLSLLVTALGGWGNGSGKSHSETAASLAVQKAAREITDGKSAAVSSGILTVQMPLINNQGNYDRANNGNQVKLYLSNGTLYRQLNTNTPVSLATDITGAAFSVSGNTVTLAITAKGRNGKNTMQTQFTQVVALRNVDAS